MTSLNDYCPYKAHYVTHKLIKILINQFRALFICKHNNAKQF